MAFGVSNRSGDTLLFADLKPFGFAILGLGFGSHGAQLDYGQVKRPVWLG